MTLPVDNIGWPLEHTAEQPKTFLRAPQQHIDWSLIMRREGIMTRPVMKHVFFWRV